MGTLVTKVYSIPTECLISWNHEIIDVWRVSLIGRGVVSLLELSSSQVTRVKHSHSLIHNPWTIRSR